MGYPQGSSTWTLHSLAMKQPTWLPSTMRCTRPGADMACARSPLSLCSRSWRICSWISLCCSSNCREPSSRSRAICRAGGGGVTTLCRSSSRLAHLAKVPERIHLQAGLCSLRVGQITQLPQERQRASSPHPAATHPHSGHWVWVLTSRSSVVVLLLSSSSSLPWAWACRSLASRSRHKG